MIVVRVRDSNKLRARTQKRESIMPLTIFDAKKMIDAVCDRWVSLGRAPDTLYKYNNHVNGAADVARTIAYRLGNIDPEQIYVSALLHDIAKIDESPESHVGRFHGILGYELLKDKDPNAARACLLHEIPWNKVPPSEYKFLGNKDDYEFALNFVAENPSKEEDLLIQLADAMANKNGIVTMEQRKQDYEQRFNMEIPAPLFHPYMDLKQYFDKKIGGNIYDLFF